MKRRHWLGCAVLAVVFSGWGSSPALAAGADVLLLGDGNAEEQVQAALEAAGHNVVFGGLYYEWDGEVPDVNDFDVVVYLDGWDYGYAMTPEGETALADFVAGGGGLVITEWAAYDAYHGDLSPAIAALMPVVSPDGDYGYTNSWNVLDPTHPLTAWLPSQWGDAAEYSYVEPVEGATVIIAGADGTPMLTYRDDVGGTVVHVNHDMTYTTYSISPKTLAVLINAAEFAAGMQPADCNGNEVFDFIDVADGDGTDFDRNRVLDECEDCNTNGLPDAIDLEALTTVQIDFGTRSDTGLTWRDSADDDDSNVVLLPFPVTLGGETFVAFVQSSNGYVELLHEGESAYVPDFGSVSYLTGYGDPTHTYLMAAYDDLSSDYFGFYGFQLRSDHVVFYWLTETSYDGDYGYLNEFEIILHADGRVQWDFNFADYDSYGYDLFTGLYLGYDSETLIEVASGWIPDVSSWQYTEAGGVEAISFEFSLGTGLDWRDSADDDDSNVVPLPFPVTLGGETYVAFVQDSNGYVELLRAGEDAYQYGYGGVGGLTGDGDPTHTFLMAAYDDLSSDYFGYYGYRVEPERVIFYWLTETYYDADYGYLNEFEIILFDDSRVQWNFGLAGYDDYDYGLFTGLYLGHDSQTLIEVTSGEIPSYASWLHSEGDGVQSIPFMFVSGDATLDWEDSDDDDDSAVVDLPFVVTLGGETFVAFVQDSNGYVELLRAGEDPYYRSYGSVDELTTYVWPEGGPTHTFLMAAYDDLSSEYYGHYGYRLEVDRVVFQWYTETYCDSDYGLLNQFEMILFDDGRVRWNFDFAGYQCFDDDLFTGVYLGYDTQALHEAFRGTIPGGESWLFDEAGLLGGGSVDENGNGVPDECEPLTGDSNCDGYIDVGDIDAFVLALTDPAAYEATYGDCDLYTADCNDDGDVNFFDIDCFVGLLTGG